MGNGKKMTGYEVTWSTVVEAESFIDAAKQAFGMMRDEDDTSTFLRINNIETRQSVFEDFEELTEAKCVTARWFVDAFTIMQNRKLEGVCVIEGVVDTEDHVEAIINLEEDVNYELLGEVLYGYYKSQQEHYPREEEDGWNTLGEASNLVNTIKRAKDFGYERIAIKSE